MSTDNATEEPPKLTAVGARLERGVMRVVNEATKGGVR